MLRQQLQQQFSADHKIPECWKNRIIFVIYDSPSAESKELMSKGIDFYSNK